MPSVAPAARAAYVVESIAGLQRLQREMARVSQRDESYESKKRALQAAIQELLEIYFRQRAVSAGRSLRHVSCPPSPARPTVTQSRIVGTIAMSPFKTRVRASSLQDFQVD